MKGKRRQAREEALGLLYQMEIRGRMDAANADKLIDSIETEDRLIREFTGILVKGVIENTDSIDLMLVKCSLNWKLGRMSYMDRNLLRIAAFEICFLPEIPAVVSINEAIEISKIYGADDSPKFINGILNRVKEETGKNNGQETEK